MAPQDGRVLVLDAGSSALKAVLFDAAGRVLASAEAAYGPEPAPHRRPIEDWWRAAVEAVRRLVPERPDALALTGTMENLVALDGDAEPVAPAILYPDPCGAPHLAAAQARLAALGAQEILGNSPEPLMTAFKLAALRAGSPAAARTATILPGAKDALGLRLTGRTATDAVTASTTGLMHMAARRWSPALAAALDVAPSLLPPILPADAVLGPLTPEAAAELGLAAGLPVVNGCGDAGATTLGAFCDTARDVSLYLGTSGWAARVAPASTLGEARPVYRLAHPVLADAVIEISPLLSAGAAGGWLRGVLGLDVAAAEAAALAADAAPADLLFLPYVAGERAPFVDLAVRGAFLGLDAAHGPGDLARAALEGIAFAARANLEALGGADGALTLAGGGAASAVWPAILADVLGRPVAVPREPKAATARGAFRLAARALRWPDAGADAVTLVAARPGRRARAERLYRAFADATAFARALAPTLGAET